MDLWKRYLFESHSEETLRSWAKRLHLFRFFRAFGGHANDADSLDVAYRYNNFEELERFFSFIDLQLGRYTEEPPQPEAGVAYSMTEYKRFPSLIPETRWIRQPGHCEIAGYQVYIWCGRERITVSIGTNYEITEADIQAAEVIEKILDSCPLEAIDPPRDSDHYICPKYYSDYFD